MCVCVCMFVCVWERECVCVCTTNLRTITKKSSRQEDIRQVNIEDVGDEIENFAEEKLKKGRKRVSLFWFTPYLTCEWVH